MGWSSGVLNLGGKGAIGALLIPYAALALTLLMLPLIFYLARLYETRFGRNRSQNGAPNEVEPLAQDEFNEQGSQGPSGAGPSPGQPHAAADPGNESQDSARTPLGRRHPGS
jgi:hypothetical protein